MLSSLKIPYHASLWKLLCLQPRIKLELKFWKQRESKPFFRLLGEPPFHCFCASRGHGGEAKRILLLLRQMTRVSMASCVSPLRCLFDHEKCLRHLRLTLVRGGGGDWGAVFYQTPWSGPWSHVSSACLPSSPSFSQPAPAIGTSFLSPLILVWKMTVKHRLATQHATAELVCLGLQNFPWQFQPSWS